jgi:UDP-glucose 4-epimerase
MIYGKGCKGNYPLLSRFAQKFPVFPDIRNERSMLHVENLCECIRMIIDDYESGFFYPQNKEYISTSELVKEIASAHGYRVRLTKVFNPLIYLLAGRVKVINKVFGSFTYDKEISNYKDFAYCINDFEDTVRKTEI